MSASSGNQHAPYSFRCNVSEEYRFWILQAGAGVEGDYLVGGGDPAGLAEASYGGEVGGAFGADEGSLQLRQPALCGKDLGVVDRDRAAVRLGHRPQHEEVAESLRHGDAEGNGLRVRPRLALG